MKRLLKLGVVVGVVGALLISGTMAVFAQGPRDADGVGLGFGMKGPMGGRLGHWGQGHEAIAEALGLTVEQLQAQLRDGATLADLAEDKGVALQELRDLAEAEAKANVLDRLEQALENGNTSEAFRSWFKKGVDSGYVLAFDGSRIENPTIVAAAEALKMTPEQVELEMWGGRTLAQLAERAGVKLEDVQAAIEAARKAADIERIQQAVEDGELTSEQAEWMIEGVENGFGGAGRLGIGSFERGQMPMMDGWRGRGAPQRGPFQMPCAPSVTTAPATGA